MTLDAGVLAAPILLTVLITAALWRFQGGAWFAARLPGRPVWWVAPAFAGLAFALHCDAGQAVGVLIATLWMSFWPHGRWYTLGRALRDLAGPPSMLERVIERATAGEGGWDDHAAFLVVKCFASIGFIALALAAGSVAAVVLALALPFLILAAYELGWRWAERAGPDRSGTQAGEWLTGAALGGVLVGL